MRAGVRSVFFSDVPNGLFMLTLDGWVLRNRLNLIYN